MATHSSILAWRIPINRGPWQAIVHGVTKSRTRRTAKEYYFMFTVNFIYIIVNADQFHNSLGAGGEDLPRSKGT